MREVVDTMSQEQEWQVEVIVVEDNDGTVLGYSESTDAFRIYGEDENLAYRVAQAQGIAKDNDPHFLAEHYVRHADQRDELERHFNEKYGNK